MYIDIHIYIYMYIYIHIYICISPQWLCSNSCTWALDVRFHLHHAQPYIYIYQITKFGMNASWKLLNAAEWVLSLYRFWVVQRKPTWWGIPRYRTRLIHNGITHNGLSKAALGVPIFVWFSRSMSAECVLKSVEYKQLSFSEFWPTNESIVFEHFS